MHILAEQFVFFLGNDDQGFLKEEVKSYVMSHISPLNSLTLFFCPLFKVYGRDYLVQFTRDPPDACCRYIIRLEWDGEKRFKATTYSFFGRRKTIEFTPEDVTIPDIDGPLTSFKIRGQPMFADPNYFSNLNGYEKLLGYDKPMDFRFGGAGTGTGAAKKA